MLAVATQAVDGNPWIAVVLIVIWCIGLGFSLGVWWGVRSGRRSERAWLHWFVKKARESTLYENTDQLFDFLDAVLEDE